MWIIRTFNNTTVNCHNKIPRHDINLGPHLCLNAPCHGKGSGAQSRQSLLKSGFTRSETGNFGHQAVDFSILMTKQILDIGHLGFKLGDLEAQSLIAIDLNLELVTG